MALFEDHHTLWITSIFLFIFEGGQGMTYPALVSGETESFSGETESFSREKKAPPMRAMLVFFAGGEV
ncbi:MAG: hypothetical protein LBO67_05180 [Spirochaetaceae bacterium]|jgi:hypothetical protein|nr:hypothetical protein [Spirochaetaceae bacterium]